MYEVLIKEHTAVSYVSSKKKVKTTYSHLLLFLPLKSFYADYNIQRNINLTLLFQYLISIAIIFKYAKV